MLKELAKNFNKEHNNSDVSDLEQFARLVLNKFIEELEQNKTTVVWNYGCDSVIFYSKDTETKSLMTIKEKYVGK